jgi:DNA-binding NarL/FixJ family response regulator
MPRINGFEATKRIKRIRPEVKVVVVTAFPVDNAIRQQMYGSGVDALLRKHDVATSLVPTIRSLHQTDTSTDSLLA